MTIAALRTPESRFENLPGYTWAPQYLSDLHGYKGLRMHLLDEGPKDATHVYLCLHGNPAWSYLYRKMIPVFLASGGRVVAPDMFGFGRSDKPVDDAVHQFDFHRESLLRLVERLDLKRITLVCQDWGGVFGLTLPMAMSERFERLLVMNTLFAGGDMPLSEGFLNWRAWCAKQQVFDLGKLHRRSSAVLSEAEAKAYDAPFPDVSYQAALRRFPQMVPEFPNDPGAEYGRRARAWFETQWQGKSFMAVGVKDPVFGLPVMQELRSHIRNCPESMQIADGGHFVQEWGDTIARAALRSRASQPITNLVIPAKAGIQF